MSPEPTPQNPDWRRVGRSTVVPLLLLVALLVLLGHMHIDLATGYTAPRLVCDQGGGFLFYDGGTRDSGFFFREVSEADGKVTFSKQQYVRGVLAAAALQPERVVTLYADRKGKDWFYSLSKRDTLDRTWSGTFSDRDLHLDFPRHVASLDSSVYVFGSDAAGNLRAVAIESQRRSLRPVATLDRAALVEGLERDAEQRVRPPLLFSTAVHQGELYIAWRVGTEVRTGGVPPGEVRWCRFDGKGFGALHRFQTDLSAFTLGEGRDGKLRLYGVGYGKRDSKILVFELEGLERETDFRPAAPIAYQREGLTGGAGVVALATGHTPKHTFLFAQIGAAIRYLKDSGDGFGEWKDLARRPKEQTAVVYGWFASLLLISVLLMVAGARSFVARRQRGAKPQPQTERQSLDELASIPERALAFSIDLALIVGLSSVLIPLLPSYGGASLPQEPRAQLTLLALFTVLLLGYFVVCEALFARTLGKRLLGLEVQDVDGGRPSFGSAIYRNVFRIELLLPPLYVVPVLSLLLMLTSQHCQRPGDLVARTTVRRSETAGRAEAEGEGLGDAHQEPAQEQ